MATGIRYDLADPETDPGWDFTAPGGVQKGQPSIAMWSWARRGQFPMDTQVTEANMPSWRTLSAAAPEITVRARAQFARDLFLSSKSMQWFYLNADGAIDNTSYTGSDMVHYLGNGYLQADTQLCGVDGQRGVPPRSQFKKFSQILEQYMGERVPVPRPATPRSEGRENGNSLVGNSQFQSNGNPPTKEIKPPLEFADLQRMYRNVLFADANVDWYTWYEGTATGPFPGNTLRDLSVNDSLPNTYPLRGVANGSSPPGESEFKSFEALLLEIHAQQES